MSTHAVEQFYQQVVQNPALQARLTAATDEAAVLNLAVELGQEHGLTFTVSEVKAWLDGRPTAAALELQDDDLDRVSGGNALIYSPLVQLPPVV